MAQNHGPGALSGTVSSLEEGKMEGVMVSAKRPGSTIMVSVSTNAQGQYSFPQDRLAPGAYDITIRAVGYTLKPTAATIESGGPARLDLSLAKAAPDVLALQMSNSEWMQSAPGTPGQKMAVLRCYDCHGLQRPFFSKGQCVGNGVHAATHDRAYCQCLSQFSILPSERNGDIRPSAD
jgi:virginiamycin B lyase